MALKNAVKNAEPVLLEPMMSVEVVTPEEFTGDVIGDINKRRGNITGVEPRAKVQVICAEVPLSEMFGYTTDLRSMTQGRATNTMQFLKYEKVPKQLGKDIVAQVMGYV
jgi:elongation factor G